MKVGEIATKDVVSVRPDESVKEALGLLFKIQISGLPVIDGDGRLVGMFTEKEILSYLLPSYVERVGRFIYDQNPKAIKKKFAELSKLKVSQLMRKDIVTTTEDTALCEVARVMLTQKARRLPVLDKTGKVLGIIARSDVLKAISKEASINTGE